MRQADASTAVCFRRGDIVRRTKGKRPLSAIANNVLDLKFPATAPNQKWVADFPYIWTWEGCLFVAAVIDLYSRRVDGWSMKAQIETDLVTDTSMMSVRHSRPTDDFLHHSDQLSLYLTGQFRALRKTHSIERTMSLRGGCWDNTAFEGFFPSIKSERMKRKNYTTRN